MGFEWLRFFSGDLIFIKVYEVSDEFPVHSRESEILGVSEMF